MSESVLKYFTKKNQNLSLSTEKITLVDCIDLSISFQDENSEISRVTQTSSYVDMLSLPNLNNLSENYCES